MELQSDRTETVKEGGRGGGQSAGMKRKHEEEADSPTKKLVGHQLLSQTDRLLIVGRIC